MVLLISANLSASLYIDKKREENCICRKNKIKKGGSYYENLIKCITEKGAENLKNGVNTRKDSYLITKIGNHEEYQIIAEKYQ